MDKWTVTAARVITPSNVIENGYVTIEGGAIASTGEGIPSDPGRVVSAAGATVTPGLIDIHTHGSFGHWGFFETKEVLAMARELPKSGVTAFCPATVSLPHKQVVASVKVIREAMDQQSPGRNFSAAASPESGSRILGINLEGPYINSKRPGAHNPMCIRNPKDDEIAEVLEAAGDYLRIFTLAPENPGGMELTRKLSEAGIIVSIGHSDADTEQTRAAHDAGANLITHLFNATRPFHQREPGVSFAALLTPGLFVELIADGKHSHPDSLKLASKVKSSSEIILVTDSIMAAGLGPGKYNVWGFTVEVKDGISQLPDGTIAGSVLCMNTAIKNMSGFTGLPLETCVSMATANPAKLLGLENRAGALVPGASADIAVFDAEMNCLATIVAGHVVFRDNTFPI